MLDIAVQSVKQHDRHVRDKLSLATIDDGCRLLGGEQPSPSDAPLKSVSYRAGNPRLPEVAARRLETMRLWKAGFNYNRIARRFGVYFNVPREDVHKGVRQWHTRNGAPMPPELDIDQLLERIPEEALTGSSDVCRPRHPRKAPMSLPSAVYLAFAPVRISMREPS